MVNKWLNLLFPSWKVDGEAIPLQAWQALGVPGGWGYQISRQSQGKMLSLSDLHTSRLYPQEVFLVLICVTVSVDPRTTLRPEGLGQWNIPVTPSRIDPAYFLMIAQWLNQLRHFVSPVPLVLKKKILFFRWPNMTLSFSKLKAAGLWF